MKIIFNSKDFTFVDNMLLRLNALEEEIYNHDEQFVCTINTTHVYRAVNQINGKHVIKLHTQHKKLEGSDVLNVVMVEFNNLMEMFHYLDSLSVFLNY